MSDIKTGYIECIYYEVFEFLNLLWPPQLVHPSLRVPIKSKPPRLNALHGCPLLAGAGTQPASDVCCQAPHTRILPQSNYLP